MFSLIPGWVVVLVAKTERSRVGGKGLHEMNSWGKFLMPGRWSHGAIKKVVAWLRESAETFGLGIKSSCRCR